MSHGSDDSSRNEFRRRNFSTGAKRKADSAGNRARARANGGRYSFDTFFYDLDDLEEIAEAGDSRRKGIKRTKGMMESSLCTGLADWFSGRGSGVRRPVIKVDVLKMF